MHFDSVASASGMFVAYRTFKILFLLAVEMAVRQSSGRVHPSDRRWRGGTRLPEGELADIGGALSHSGRSHVAEAHHPALSRLGIGCPTNILTLTLR